MLPICIEIAVMILLIFISRALSNSWSDFSYIVSGISGIFAFFIFILFVAQMIFLWTGPIDDREFIARVEAVRATPRGLDYDSATWRLKVADINADIASRKFGQKYYPAWHAPEIQKLEPITIEK